MVYTIGQVSAHSHLSRSTLLYYDRIGLLSPSQRSQAGYRLYDQADLARLERIRTYRAAGLPLDRIQELLDADDPDQVTQALEAQLTALNWEIQSFREQQRVVIELLGQRRVLSQGRVIDIAGWTALLREIGLDEAAMLDWHRAFEQKMPEAHQDFLESLGLDATEVSRIRQMSRTQPDEI